jgi:hypothetical protein
VHTKVSRRILEPIIDMFQVLGSTTVCFFPLLVAMGIGFNSKLSYEIQIAREGEMHMSLEQASWIRTYNDGRFAPAWDEIHQFS